MDIAEIIKDAFAFPSKNLGALAIYIVLSILVSAFAFGGVFTSIFGFTRLIEYLVIGAVYLIISIMIGFIMSGYQISIIKSGIELDDEAPDFEWEENLISGVKNTIVAIVYFIIPAIIVAIVGIITNVPANIASVGQEFASKMGNVTVHANAYAPAVNVASQSFSNLVGSLAITLTVALVLFIIFSFIQTIAEARLADTGSLVKALNIPEAVKDIMEIGAGKFIGLIVLIVIISLVIEIILAFAFNYMPFLSILSLIITPYLLFFANRAVGLLYFDIAYF